MEHLKENHKFRTNKKIRENCNLKIELGGGIRDEETIKMYVELGVDRLILGSIAVKIHNL